MKALTELNAMPLGASDKHRRKHGLWSGYPGKSLYEKYGLMAAAHPSRVKGERADCLDIKRPSKPDTGNPFVRFDEGEVEGEKTDNYGPLILSCFQDGAKTRRIFGRGRGASEEHPHSGL
jgi:hypothetical protein